MFYREDWVERMILAIKWPTRDRLAQNPAHVIAKMERERRAVNASYRPRTAPVAAAGTSGHAITASEWGRIKVR